MRHLALLLLVALFAVGCDRMSGSAKLIQGHVDRAKKLYEQRDYDGVIAAYEDVLRIDPQHSESHYQIALICDKNLNDPLSAAYHYQQFLRSANPDPSRVELVKSFLENAKLQIAASTPNVAGQQTPELVKLRTENAALYAQVEELKREIVRSRTKAMETKTPVKVSTPPVALVAPITPTPTPPVTLSQQNTKAVPRVETKKVEVKAPVLKTAARPKSYVVKKGEGIQAIAEKIYGDRSKWRQIVAANPSIKKNPNQLSPGQVLVLP
jgi:tetratricopeptide (TPR) repeat protein